MFIEIAALAAGMVPGRLLKDKTYTHKPVARATTLSVYALLFILGAKIGGNQTLFANLDELGLQALVIGFLGTIGSAVFARLAAPFFRDQAERKAGRKAKPQSTNKSDVQAPEQTATQQTATRQIAGVDQAAPSNAHGHGQTIQADNPNKNDRSGLIKGLTGSVIILIFFFIGLTLARIEVLPPSLYAGNISLYLLRLMLFFVGIGVGFDLGSLLIVRNMGRRVLLLPVLTLAGTFAGAGLAFMLLALDLHSCMIVSAGMGYYSLASVVVSESCGAALGSIALIANLFRELFCLLAAPLLAKLFGPLGAVTAAGAPAMDTCLPMIARSTNKAYGILAIFNGLALTMLVPLLLPLIIG